MDRRAIGVFDSGVGGLTVVKELNKLLPCEDIVYFGDTGRVPYGTRGAKTVIQYARQDINFLLSKDVKIIIAACGTVSAVLPTEETDKLDVIYTGVVAPAAKTAAETCKSGKIGVIGTTASVNSGKYAEEIKKHNQNTKIIQNPCPLFVPLVENGFIEKGNEVTSLVAKKYLESFIGNVNTLIMGCTHFPIIKEIIGDIVGDQVTLIDPGKETARYVRDLLTEKKMLNKSDKSGTTEYFVSDDTESFEKTAEIFLHSSEHIGKVNLVHLST